MPVISIIIPTLNEEAHLGCLLEELAQACAGVSYELVVVDAASQDRTVEIAREHGARVVETAAGNRGHQLRLGAQRSQGQYLWFVHADVQLKAEANLGPRLVRSLGPGTAAACLWLDYAAPGFFYRFLAASSNWRAGHLGLIFGDQSLFVCRTVYQQVGGFPDVPLMEDWILSRKLARRGLLKQFPDRIIASSRKYDRHPWRVHFKLMWIKVLFICGVSPQKLAQIYYRKDR